jgi:protein MpaA
VRLYPRTAAALVVAGAAMLAGKAVLALADDDDPSRVPRAGARASHEHSTPVRRTVTIGYSVDHRPITATRVGDPAAPRTMLVVGCIHGDEQAGIPIARRLAAGPPIPGVALWVIPVLNPDGVALDTRQNANGVDLNRNFPYRWRPLGTRGYDQWSGTHPLSAPEARAAWRLITSIKPSISIWFHQPIGVVDFSGGNPAIERAYARHVGLPAERLIRYPGSVSGSENHVFPGTTAFVVELRAGALSPRGVTRYAAAARRLAGRLRR